jgi:hypothetical protein
MLLSLLLLCLFVRGYFATDCGDPSQCMSHLCPQPKHCPLGTTKEPCGCCKVCWKKEGETCGGLNGRCGLGYTCNTTLGLMTAKCERLPGCHLYNSYLAIGTSAQMGDCNVCECVKDNDLRCKRNMDRCRSVTGVTTKIKNTFPELTYIDQTTSSGDDDSDLTLP